ncbi:MAG: PilZ domain-containing protein [Nitrospirota bacterium]
MPYLHLNKIDSTSPSINGSANMRYHGHIAGRNAKSFVEKRAFERIPTIIEFHCFNREYFGTITNISEKGIYFRSQKLVFPLSVEFVICVPLKEDIIHLPVTIRRLIKTNGYYDGVGVELLSNFDNYTQFVSDLRSYQFWR